MRSRPVSARFAYRRLARRSGPSHSPSAPFGSRGSTRGERRDVLSRAFAIIPFYLFYSVIKRDSQKRRMTAICRQQQRNILDIYACRYCFMHLQCFFHLTCTDATRLHPCRVMIRFRAVLVATWWLCILDILFRIIITNRTIV